MGEQFLLNAFSLQMIDVPASVKFEEVESLPEGSTSLPEGFKFKFIKVTVE